MSDKRIHDSLNLCFHRHRHKTDLDDGVKTNYLKFEGAVQPIPGLAAKEG